MSYKLVINGEETLIIQGESVVAPGHQAKKTATITVDNAILFPGLINSHDHLDFNFFPALATRIYSSYTEWGKDIHTQHSSTISNIMRIPRALRLKWGWYKNLLNGVTTVIHHGDGIIEDDAGITLFQRMQNLHSVRFDKRWRRRLLNPFAGKLPFVIHCGEGTNDDARKEIDILLRMNWWKHTLIGIHGVAMLPEQARRFKALIWCPASNFFLLRQTAPVGTLGKATTLLFGTDSTLTAPWDTWEQLRQARATKEISDEALYHTLTHNPAAIWNLPGKGKLQPGADADIVIARKKTGNNFYDNFFAITPADILLVMHKGVIRLFDESLMATLYAADIDPKNFDRVIVQDRGKFVQKGLRTLINEIHAQHPYALIPVE